MWVFESVGVFEGVWVFESVVVFEGVWVFEGVEVMAVGMCVLCRR